MTSITFASNAIHLTNWGVSVGDVIALAGAGRGIVTWLTSNSRDNALLDFLKLTQEELDLRRGLLDTVALNKRWSKRITLFHNGRPQDHLSTKPSEDLENVCKFTWIMILIVAALDAATSNTLLQSIVVDFISKLFADAVLNLDYLQHEIPQHINGWRSAAAVRNVTSSARIAWEDLEGKPMHHLPGFIPASEHDGIVRFLMWLTTSGEDTMTTNSSDIHSLASVLSTIGFDNLSVLSRHPFSNSELPSGRCVLLYDDAWVAEHTDRSSRSALARRGMRIPLADANQMFDIVSLWPQPRVSHHDLRRCFEEGRRAASFLTITACVSSFRDARRRDVCLRVSSKAITGQARKVFDTARMTPAIRAIVEGFTLAPYCPELCKAFNAIMSNCDTHSLESIGSFLREEKNSAETVHSLRVITSGADADLRHPGWIKLRAFLLGYYYGAFTSILDVSKLRVREGFGSWSWDDFELFELLASLRRSRAQMMGNDEVYWRHDIMRCMAYLFAGAESYQISGDYQGVAGVIAKLTILTPGLLGEADTPSKISKLHLVDIDPTAIPSKQWGQIMLARQDSCAIERLTIAHSLSSLNDFRPADSGPDYTAHVEPAWDKDPALCYVVYRHSGRVVHKVDTLLAEEAIVQWWQGTNDGNGGVVLKKTIDLDNFKSLVERPVDEFSEYRVWADDGKPFMLSMRNLAQFQGGSISGFIHADTHSNEAIIIASGLKPRARTCLAAMFNDQFSRLGSDLGTGLGLWQAKWSNMSSVAVVIRNSSQAVVLL